MNDSVHGNGKNEEIDPEERQIWHWREHIGMISGLTLVLIAFVFLGFVAAAGDGGALAILVVVVIGVALIFLGGRLHGARRA